MTYFVYAIKKEIDQIFLLENFTFNQFPKFTWHVHRSADRHDEKYFSNFRFFFNFVFNSWTVEVFCSPFGDFVHYEFYCMKTVMRGQH